MTRQQTCVATCSAWCGRPESNRHRSFDPTDFLTSYDFRRRPIRTFVVWTIPSPCPGAPRVRCCPSSLYTFLKLYALRLGSGLPVERFPRIWAVLHRAFPREHSIVGLSPLRLPVSPRPQSPTKYSRVTENRQGRPVQEASSGGQFRAAHSARAGLAASPDDHVDIVGACNICRRSAYLAHRAEICN